MVSIWKVHGLKKIEFTHWLKRRVVRIELLNQLPMGRRLPVAVAGYQRTLDRFFPDVLGNAKQSMTNVDKPQKSSTHAKKMSGKHPTQPTESENASPSP